MTTVPDHAGETIPVGTTKQIERDLAACLGEGVAEIMTYRAVYERDPDGRWVVRIPDVPGCHSYGRTIDQARERIREALGLFVNDSTAARIEDDVRLPLGISKRIETAKQLRDRVTRDQREMVRAQRKAVMAIRKMKLGHRDTGRLLGLSFQRVQQLERRGSIPEMIGSSVARHRLHAGRAVKRAAKKR